MIQYLAAPFPGRRSIQNRFARLARFLPTRFPSLSIRGKLATSFVFMILMTVLGTVTGTSGLNELRRHARDVADVVLPAMMEARELQASIDKINSLAPSYQNLSSKEEAEALSVRVSSLFEEAFEQLNRLAETAGEGQEDARVAGFTEKLVALKAGQKAMEKELREKLVLQGTIDSLEARLGKAHEAISAAVLPITVNSLFDLQSVLNNLATVDDTVAVGQALAKNEVNKASFAGTMLASANLILGNIRTLPSLAGKKEIVPLMRQNAREAGRLESAYRGFVGTPEYDILKQPVSDFLEFGKRNSENNLFLRYMELAEFDARLATLATRQREGMAEVNGLIQAFAEKNGQQVRGAMQAVQSEAAARMQEMLVLLGAIILLAAGVMYFVVHRNIIQRLTGLAASMARLAAGNTADPVHMNGQDEIARMAAQVETFRLTAVEREALNAEAARRAEEDKQRERRQAEQARADAERDAQQRDEQQRAMEEMRLATLNSMAEQFEGATSEILAGVVASAAGLQRTAEQLANTATDTVGKAGDVRSLATKGAENMQDVSRSSLELLDSMKRISGLVEKSRSASDSACLDASSASAGMRQLGVAITEIDKSVTLIEDIARQTHLLALNASIEASRSGEAGKGFAVVASEVKKLASQTAHVTSEISEQIRDIQTESREAGRATETVHETVTGMNDIVREITRTIGEQQMSVTGIADAIGGAAAEAEQIRCHARDVDAFAQESRDGVEEARADTTVLSTRAQELAGEIDTFLSRICNG
ncbi:methyl-accepting chemotaxis protein [Sneathiella chinensis]|uniref:Methyl-accepting chemotaxis protein n=1 Tax=Sneathiella chinensis TaxID=349750 RepID=A0ABQ5U160_9PROT|nr:HAMP domain-containing methyl-accepting chemotaxis protein [Sneathiella chinensis]GLQ05401.1 hypothetical protein GCM10007924_06220 [Sneathiella chinensis]